ncbi:MAG: hypothetical protein HWN80_05115 [Candidatus Lokiarchaeota archaeon]|nr:hypothetical protein [Candidatus Lokiarchaeota archaeon]
MRKVKIASILLIGSLILISVGNFTIAQTPSYVGISEGQEYVWDLGLNKDGVNSLKNDFETFVDDLFTEILALDLDPYTDLNASEALLLLFENSIDFLNTTLLPGIIPSDWKTVNISIFMESLFNSTVETFNTTVLSGFIPSDWRSDNIDTFFGYVIDGLNATYPGFEEFTISDIFELVINSLDIYGWLPLGWETMTVDDLLEFSLGGITDFINTTIIPGMIPSGWFHMNLTILLQQVFPIVPQWFIDQMDEMYAFTGLTEISFFTAIDQYMQIFNYSLGTIPGDWEDLTLSDLMVDVFFPEEMQDYNITYIAEFVIENLNNTTPFDLYALSMSEIINMTIFGMTGALPIEEQAMPTLDLMRESMEMYVIALNSTLPVGLFPPDWVTLSIDDLRTHFVNLEQLYFDQLMVEVDSFLYQFELIGGFEKFRLKAIIDHIGDEIELIPGGPKGAPINITIQIRVPLSDWVNLTDLVGGDIFQYYQLYILDPTTFPADQSALIEQFLSTGGLFVGKGYDWSGIVKAYEFPGPVTSKSINFDMDWDNNGVLDHIRLTYGEQEVASIELLTTQTEPDIIPGYPLLIFTGITLFSIGVLIISIKKKKPKF